MVNIPKKSLSTLGVTGDLVMLSLSWHQYQVSLPHNNNKNNFLIQSKYFLFKQFCTGKKLTVFRQFRLLMGNKREFFNDISNNIIIPKNILIFYKWTTWGITALVYCYLNTVRNCCKINICWFNFTSRLLSFEHIFLDIV